jgi:BirA family biotin operon repressor/biotin-[acetyl-CoA-carboxylase] ligase
MLLQKDFNTTAKSLATAARSVVENVLIIESIDSTQACALRLVDQAEAEEIILPTTLIIAGEQEQGRGRSDRSWVSPPGGLYLSWVASSIGADAIARLPMIAAAAVSEAILGLGIENVQIKWPNDLLIDGRKCAGCLIHARHGETTWVVVGIGINLGHTPDVPEDQTLRPTSVADHLHGKMTDDVVNRIIRVTVEELAAGIADADASLVRWKKRLIHRPGDEMTIRLGDESEIHGRFTGLTDGGHLRVECDGKERTIATGDVVE